MDYCAQVLENALITNKRFNDLIFNQMEDESTFIMNTLENFSIIYEEAQTATNNSNKVGFFARIAEFFKKIFGVFSEKTKVLFDSNKKWMDENFNKLDKINYSKLKIEMIPFWNMNLNRLKNDVKIIQRKSQSILNNAKMLEKYKDFETIKKGLYVEYLDDNDDLTNGLKNYYRIGNAKGKLETVALEGNNLKSKIEEFKNYCFNYGKDIQPFVKGLMDGAEKEIERIEKILSSKQATTENFCLIENALYKHTDIAYSANFIVLEAEENADDNQKKNVSAKPTQVNIVNKADDKQKDDDEANQKYKNLSTTQLAFLKNIMQIYQLSISALMTVLEEKFRAYLNALKAIVSEGGVSDNTPAEK